MNDGRNSTTERPVMSNNFSYSFYQFSEHCLTMLSLMYILLYKTMINSFEIINSESLYIKLMMLRSYENSFKYLPQKEA